MAKDPSILPDQDERLSGVAEFEALHEHVNRLSVELERRTTNVLSTVQSIAAQTLTDEWPIERVREMFFERLHALGRAYSALDRGNGMGASLEEVVRNELHQFPGLIEIEGPPVTLAPTAVHPLALIVHELATESTERGALAVPGGRVAVQWRIEDESTFRLSWTERSSSRKRRPGAQAGTESSLVDKLSSAYGLQHRVRHSPWGLECDIEAPLSSVSSAGADKKR